MKRILTLVLCWLIAFTSMAETTFKAKTAASIAGGYVTSLNKVDGSFEDGASAWSASVGTITPTVSTGSYRMQGNYHGWWTGTGTGTLDLQWTATASNTYEASLIIAPLFEDDLYICAVVNSIETGCKLIPTVTNHTRVSVVADSVSYTGFYLRLKHTGSDPFNIAVDDGKIEPYTLNTANLTKEDVITYSGSNGWDASNRAYFKTLDPLSHYGDTVTATNSSYTKFTILQPCDAKLSVAGSMVNISGITLKHFSASGTEKHSVYTYPSDGRVAIPLITPADIGDYFYVQPISYPLTDTSLTSFSISCSKKSDNVVQSWQDGMVSWSATSTIQIGATTTAPTKGTTDLDQVKWIKRGESAEFWYQYNQTGAGTAGSGDYLFTLPNGLQFADHVTKFTNLEGIGDWNTKNTIPAGAVYQSSFVGSLYIIPYDSTRFRLGYIGGTTGNATSMGVLGSAAGALSNTNTSFSFKFTAPINGFSNAPTLYALPTRSEVFSANIAAAGTVTNATQNFVTSCTNAAPSICSLWSSFGVAPTCWTHTVDITKRAEVTATTATTVTVARTDTGTAFNLFCHLK